MKKVFSLVLAAGAVLAFAQLGFGQVGTGVEKNSEKPGAVAVETVTSTATVVAINYENRTGTLRLPDGTAVAFTVRPEVNFDQLKVGDKVSIR